MLLSIAFCLVVFGDEYSRWVPFAGLLAVMALGAGIRQKKPVMAGQLSHVFDRLWTGAEVFLFVLLGASVRIDGLIYSGPAVLLLLVAVLLFRMAGVGLCTLGTGLDRKERLFCMIAYTPKATVQAAIGGLPLAMGLPCGETVLAVSVVAVLVTAPLGAWGIDLSYRRLLKKTPPQNTDNSQNRPQPEAADG